MQMALPSARLEEHSIDFNARPNLRDVMRPKIPLRVKGPFRVDDAHLPVQMTQGPREP